MSDQDTDPVEFSCPSTPEKPCCPRCGEEFQGMAFNEKNRIFFCGSIFGETVWEQSRLCCERQRHVATRIKLDEVERERDEALSSSSERGVVVSQVSGALVDAGCAVGDAMQFGELVRGLVKERDEARSERQAGYDKAARAEAMLWKAAAMADQWRKCAESLADILSRWLPRYGTGACNDGAGGLAALADYKRLKEESK